MDSSEQNAGPPDFASQGQADAESANPFAAAGGPTSDEPMDSAAAAQVPAAAGPIDPDLFSGPPVADSYAQAGTGIHGSATQPGKRLGVRTCQLCCVHAGMNMTHARGAYDLKRGKLSASLVTCSRW